MVLAGRKLATPHRSVYLDFFMGAKRARFKSIRARTKDEKKKFVRVDSSVSTMAKGTTYRSIHAERK